jgi:GNAT superfamily N-acetyltransferase
VTDARLDALAESARNRGLKLVRSRVRTPGKRRFGKVGLTDAAGKSVFGMDSKGPTASVEAVEEYLRDLTAGDWGASLDKAPPRKRAARKAQPKPKPEAKPKPQIRDAKPGDAAALVPLMALLDHRVDEKGVRKRVSALEKDKLAPLVATLDKRVVGLCGIDVMAAVHRDQPVGRINILVVEKALRGEGIGRLLCDAAEQRLRELGCRIVEVTSNDRLTQAHAFYRSMGYERTSLRFCKTL